MVLVPGRRSEGLILTCVIGIAGALLGGWVATKLFHVHSLHGFFNLSTWITAIIGAAVLAAPLPPHHRAVLPPVGPVFWPVSPVRAPLKPGRGRSAGPGRALSGCGPRRR